MKWVITVEKNKGFKRRRMFQNAAYEVLEAVGYQMVESGLIVCFRAVWNKWRRKLLILRECRVLGMTGVVVKWLRDRIDT